jgi:hypothetical protein
MSQLAWALLGQGKFTEAESLVVQGFEGMKARESKMPPNGKQWLHEAAQPVVKLYGMWGKPETATKWRIKLGLDDLPRDLFAPIRKH